MATEKVTIGKMDRRITIQTRSLVEGDHAEQQEVFTFLTECSAQVEFPTTTSGEEIQGGLQTDYLRAHFRIHWRSDLTPLNRVVYEGENYDVNFITQIGRRQYLMLVTIRRK